MTARALALLVRIALALAGAGAAASNAFALAFTLNAQLGDDYTYTLTYGPNDNMWWEENGEIHATILLTGLYGVTAVSGPTDNDFPEPGPIHDGQLKWTGGVLFGGTAVRFTMPDEDVGTGNFPSDKHVFGFTLTAPGTGVVGTIQLDTFGFYNGHTLADRDVHMLIEGPGRPIDRDPPGRLSEAPTAALAMLGLLALAPRARGRRGRRGRRS